MKWTVFSKGLTSDQDTILDAVDGYHDTPSQDSADNTQVRDIVGNKTDTVGGNSLIALLKQLLADVETQPLVVSRATATLPDNTATPYFTVSGRVLITQIVGEVTEVCSAQATNLNLVANPTVGADVDMCAVVAIADDAVGTLYTITGTLADAMVATTSGAVQAQLAPILVADGTIDLKTSDTNTGKTKWVLHYVPLDSGSSIVAC